MAHSAAQLHRATLGPQASNPSAFWSDPALGDETQRHSAIALLRRYGFWVQRCVSLNAQVAASVPFRLFSLGKEAQGFRVFGRMAKPLDAKTKAFLSGRHAVQPSAKVMSATRGRLDEMTELQSHPALDLLNDVNKWTDGYGMREALYSDLQIFGRAYLNIIEDVSLRPVDLWRMLPHKTKVLPDPNVFVAGFRYGDPPTAVVYPPRDVLWFRLFDPANPWGGLGPLEAWLKTIDAAFAIQSFQDWLFKRGGAPDYVVKSEVAPTKDQKRSFMEGWREMFGRLKWRLRNVAFISGKGADLVRIGQTNRELEFSKSAGDIRDQIGQGFGVPKSKLTTDDVNRANARQTDEIHIRDTIWPMVQRVEGVENEHLLPRFGGNLLLIHDNPVPGDETIRIQERKSKLESGWTINEIKTEEGEEPIADPNADIPLVAAGLSTLERIVNPPEPPSPFGLLPGEEEEPKKPPKDEEESAEESDRKQRRVDRAANIVKALEEGKCNRGAALGLLRIGGYSDGEIKALLPEPEPPPELPVEFELLPGAPKQIEQEKMWRAEYAGQLDGALRLKQENATGGGAAGFPVKLAVAIRRMLRAQLRKIAGKIGDEGLEAGLALLRNEEAILDFAEELRPKLWQSIVQGLDAGLSHLPAEAVAEFNVHNPAVVNFANTYMVRLARQVNGATEHLLIDLIGTGLEEQHGTQEITRAIMQMDASVSGHRAERIARTEVARAHVAGERVAWQSSGVVAGKQWLLSPNPCEFCKRVALDFQSQLLPVDEPFYKLGHVLRGVEGGTMALDYTDVDGPPLHPHCRCDLLPVLKG